MHSIRAILIKPFTKPFIKAGAKLICISLLLITQTAHADFRKALDAYMARDGATMLKEVKDAVDKKNDDGLMLLLMATNMDAATSDYDETTKQSKSTLRAILPQPKWDEMRELLTLATNNSTVDAQYYLLTSNQLGNPLNKINKQFIEDHVKHGSRLAMSQSNIQNKAEAGDLVAQLSLGFKYMGFDDEYGCQKLSTDPICLSKDEVKGNYWLKQAVKGYEASGHDSLGNFADRMCEFIRQKSNGNRLGLRQAYLWCLVGANAPEGESRTLLSWMRKRGELKIAAPEIDAKWDESKRHAIFERSNLTELPDWIVESRKQLLKEDTPAFTYFESNNLGYEVDVFADGRVKIGLGSEYMKEGFNNKSLWMKVPPIVVQQFIVEIKSTEFEGWPIVSQANTDYGCVDNFDNPNNCKVRKYQFTLRHGSKYHRKYLVEFERTPINGKSSSFKRASKIYTLTEKYFSTKLLRCSLGGSQKYEKACLFYDRQLKTLANRGE